MKTVTFKVKMSPMSQVGRLVDRTMQSADLCDGVAITQHFTVTWKEGENVGKKRIELAKKTLKQALEDLHYDCYSIRQA